MNEPTVLDAATDFDHTTNTTPIPGREGEFAVDLDAGWSSLVGVHGGYMCAIVVRAAESLVVDRTVRTVTTSFLRNAQVGPATVSVRLVRAGRAMTTMVADLVQDDRLLLTSRLTLLVEHEGVEWSEPLPPDLPPPAACARFELPGLVSHFSRADSAFDPATLPFNVDRARVNGYVRPLERRPIDASWLTMASDWFPPPAFSLLEPPTGGVSIDLTTHIHRTGPALDAEDWLAGDFEITNSTGGLAVEHGRITRVDGTLVAESFQTRLSRH